MADIFIRALPEQSTDRQLTDYLAPILRPLNTAFLVRKLKAKNCALLTISSVSAAKKFEIAHCSPVDSRARPRIQLMFLNKKIYCSPARDEPDPFVIQGLRQQKAEKTRENHKSKGTHTFAVDSVSCGQWTYIRDRLNYLECYEDTRHGSIVLGDKRLVIFLVKTGKQQENVRIDIDYYAVESITTGALNGRSTITFSLLQSPRFSTYELEGEYGNEQLTSMAMPKTGNIEAALAMLSLSTNRRGIIVATQRELGLSLQHETLAGSCLVYQVVVTDPKDLNILQNTLRNTHGTPSIIWHPTSRHPLYDFQRDFRRLLQELTNRDDYGLMPFEVLFQMQALAQNAILNPKAVRELLPHIKEIIQSRTYTSTALAEGPLIDKSVTVSRS
jgi:hypothetical protein